MFDQFVWIFIMLFHACRNVLFFIAFLGYRWEIFLLLLKLFIWRSFLSYHWDVSIRNINVLCVSFGNRFPQHFLIIFLKSFDLFDIKWIQIFKRGRSLRCLRGSIGEWLIFFILFSNILLILIIKLRRICCIQLSALFWSGILNFIVII